MEMEPGAKMRMKEWLIAQIESGIYEGLRWENGGKTMFRIPWKHAAKKDYEQSADAALFKAWAVHKGKHREGKDKADPTMWKTRLRCALNKSTDFQEVPERNQLDITEPYKVYLILNNDNSSTPARRSGKVIKDGVIQMKESPITPRVPNREELLQAGEDKKLLTDILWREHMYCGPMKNNPLNPTSAHQALFSPAFKISDFTMQVEILYYGKTVLKATTTGPEGCFIMQGKVPVANERIYGPCSTQQISFPTPASLSLPQQLTDAMNRLLCHLEKGVLLWVAPDGMFIKRFCRGRVYWSGPMAQGTGHPNKLEREKTFKLLDIPTFLNDLHNCLTGKGAKPSYTTELCFGEEFPDPTVPKTTKLIVAQVVPLFAVELLQRFNLIETDQRQPNLDTGGKS
ncbi:interferon regulatory factor 10 isoform X3 [Nelusetta ayraudi]